MLTLNNLARLRSVPESGRRELLAELGDPTPEQVAEAAVAAMPDPDRNVRVMLLRLLDTQETPRAIEGILLGLNDSERRVREVAVKCSVKRLSDSRIIKRLKEIALDEKEKRKTRQYAFGHVVSGVRTGGGPASGGAEFSRLMVEEWLNSEKYRQKVLFHLVMLEMTDEVEDLLRSFVKNGTKEEAVTATRALCGYKVINLGGIDDREEKKLIRRTCEPAAGRVFYWVKRRDGA